MVKYFKKLFPTTKVVIGKPGEESLIEFSTSDKVTGYYATDIEFVQQEFERLMREQRYGITEISEEEFKADYVEKKNQPVNFPKIYREELSQSRSRQTVDPSVRLGSASTAAALRVDGSADVRRNNPAGVQPLETKAPAAVTVSDSREAPGPSPMERPVANVGKRTKPAK